MAHAIFVPLSGVLCASLRAISTLGTLATDGDRRESLDRIEAEGLVQRGVDGVAREAHQQRVAVGRAADDDGEGPALGGGQQLGYGRGGPQQSGQACAARDRELHLVPGVGKVRMPGTMGAELNGTCWSYRSDQWRPGSGGAVPACAWAQLQVWKRVGLGCCFFRSATKDDLA